MVDSLRSGETFGGATQSWPLASATRAMCLASPATCMRQAHAADVCIAARRPSDDVGRAGAIGACGCIHTHQYRTRIHPFTTTASLGSAAPRSRGSRRSKGVTRQVRERVQLSQDRVRTIYNGFAVDRIRSLGQQAVSHPWFNDADTPIVLAVGRSAPSKDHPTLVAAFCRVRRRRGARLVFIGEFPTAERSHLPGPRQSPSHAATSPFIDFDENPYCLHAPSVCVRELLALGRLSSALLEAMASGTLSLQTDAPFGTAEILADGRWGALVPVGDAVRLAQAIEATLDGERPSARDLQRRAADFDASACAIEYEKLFAEVVAAA